MELEELIIKITGKERYNYKCFDLLKQLLRDNIEFRNIIIEGIKENKISGFTDEIWEMIHNQNIRGIDNFESVFRDGYNIGYCTPASKQLSYSLFKCYICGGVLPILKGTPNCPDGSHTWIQDDRNIIDTSLMLIIDKSYIGKLGYITESIVNPRDDLNYRAAQDFTTDENLRPKK